jgi:HK97 family phage major capsid protein
MSKNELKYVKIPDGVEFEADQMEFLGVLDNALNGAIDGTAKKGEFETLQKEMRDKLAELAKTDKLEKMQEQMDNVFLKLNDWNVKPKSDKQVTAEMKHKTNEWIKALIKRDKIKMESIAVELEKGSPVPWAPGDGGDPVFADGPVVMHGKPAPYDQEQGAYLVPELLLAEVNRWVYEAGIARRDMRYLPFSGPGNTRRIPVLLQSVVVSWVDQAGVKPKTKPYIGQVEQTLEKLAAIVIFTEEIIEDSAIDLIALCGQLFGEAIAIEEDRVFLPGSILAGDPFNGVINAAGVVPVALAGGGVTPDALNAAIYQIPTPARKGAKWYMHPTVYGDIQTLRADVLAPGDGLGNYLVQHPVEGGPPTLWGYPIVVTDELPTIAAAGAGNPFMFFANLMKTCVYGDKMGLRVKMLTEASITDDVGEKINLAENDLIAMRVHKRVGYVPVLPDGIAVFTV